MITPEYRSERTIGAHGAVWGGLHLPVDVSVGPSGRLFFIIRGQSAMSGSAVAGTQDQVAKAQIRVNVWSFDDEELGRFGKAGWGDGELVWPSAVATDDRERVYVSDEARHDIQVFDADGRLLQKWGTPGEGPGQFNRPAGLAVNKDGTVLVADAFNNRIQRLGPNGEPLASWGTYGSGPGQLDQPWGLAIDGGGDVYVADWGNDRVQKFSADGRYLATFGSSGSGAGQLRRPSGVAVDLDGDVYVADPGNDRVQVYSRDGAHRATLTGDSHLSKHSVRYYRNFPQFWEGFTSVPALREEERHFVRPTAVKIDAHGRLLVVDSSRHRLQVFEKITTDPTAPASPLLTYFVRSWRGLGTDADRALFAAHAARVEAVRGTPEDEDRRAWLATDWLIRTLAPAWLDLAGLSESAQRLRDLPEMTSRERARSVMPILTDARDAAESAAVRVDWAPEPRAAWEAARDAAWPPARFAPWEEPAGIIRDAIGAAAFAAKPVPPIPWPGTTRQSALALLDRMIAVGKD